MSKDRVELLPIETAVERSEQLGLNEAVSRLNIFRTMLHRPKTAKAISDLLFSLLFGAELDDRSRERARKELGVDSGEVVCTFIGRIAPIKRVDLLIEAFAVAHSANPSLRLWIVGDGETRQELEARAASLGLNAAVRFFGYRRDLVTIWSASDLAVLSSANEGTPVSLIEAAAAGLPAISTDVGGVGEALAPGAALLVGSGDLRRLAASLGELASDPGRRTRMGASARSFAMARFSAPRLAGDLDALYTELLAARGG